MNKSIVAKNAVVAVVQIIITTGVMLVLYRYLIMSVGIERLGVWSIVMAAGSALRLGDLGLSGSASKFVAKYQALKQFNEVSSVIQTTTLSLLVIIGLFLAILYPLLNSGLGLVFPMTAIEEARILLPFSLVYLWLMSISATFQAALDGCLRTDLRGMVVIGGSVLLLGVALLLVPRYGLLGLVYAQIGQAFITAIAGWLLLRTTVKQLPSVPHQWRYGCFKEMLGYGANLQVINICVMLFEPVTKILLGKFGGLSVAGYYEMAQRIVAQIRAVLLAANQILVPVVAQLHETDARKIQDIYCAGYRLLLYLSLPAFTGIMALSPVISEFWIGEYKKSFVLYLMILCGAAVIHIISVPAYFMNLGTGYLKYNVAGHFLMTVSNAMLAVIFGLQWGGDGVIIASAIAMIIGGFTIVIPYHIKNRVSFGVLLPHESLYLFCGCIMGLGLGLWFYYFINPELSVWLDIAIMTLIAVVMIGPAVWIHPQRKIVFTLIKRGITS